MDKELRILMLEDNPADAKLMEHELSKGGMKCDTRRVETEGDFVKGLDEFNPDIVLADYNLPSFDGPTAISIVKQKYPNLPVILVSGTVGEDTAVEMLKTGAWDYILKDRLSRLVPSVRRALKEADEIAERKRLQEALWTSAREWRATFDALNNPVALLDPDRNIRRCNKAMANLLEKTFNEIIGHNCCEVMHGVSGPIEGCPVVRMRETNRREILELSLGNRWFHIVADPLPDEDGRLIGAVHIMSDITERRRMEEELRENEKAARRSAQENKVIAEIGRVISSTLEIENVYGRFAEEVRQVIPLDRIVIDLVNTDANSATIRYIAGIEIPGRRIGDTFLLDSSFTGEIVGTRSPLLIQGEEVAKIGKRYPDGLLSIKGEIQSFMGIPLISKDQVIGVLHFRSLKPNAYTESDIRLAQSIGAQIAGAVANTQLYAARIHAEKEMSALQEQLHQSQKMEAIGRLAGGIAHDFNNLLTVIKGYSQLSLAELKESDHLKLNMDEIKKAADRASDLTRQLLAFSRRQILEMKVLDLNTVLKNLDKLLHRVIGEDVELVTLLAEDLGRTKVDPGQIEQVIMNLAVNARDAMANGGKLTIETANMELDEEYAKRHVAVKPGRYVMISVSDTGVGMTPEVKERVFEPFFTTKEKDKGTGLGLSTVYGIVKQSGGNIWVYSEPDKGTTFKIYLPRVDESLEEKKEKVMEEAFPRGDETILIVEDDAVVLKLASRILHDQGYKVLEAPQGLDAFLICAEHDGPIHLLFTDVVMPKMNGREVAESIISLRPGIKVLYTSGYTDNAIVHHGILIEGMNYIQKPFTVEGLARKVREVLGK